MWRKALPKLLGKAVRLLTYFKTRNMGGIPWENLGNVVSWWGWFRVGLKLFGVGFKVISSVVFRIWLRLV